MKTVFNLTLIKNKLVFLLALFFFFGWSQNDTSEVDCDMGAYYQTIRLQQNTPNVGSKNDFILYRINPSNGQFTFIANLTVDNGPNDISVPASVNVNSLGINPIDKQFYFINARAPFQLYKMDAVGNVSYLGNVTGPISGSNQAGVFDNNGNYYVTGGSKKLFLIDINTLVSTRIMNVNFVASDLAINPNNGLLYGWDQNKRQLNTIDLVSKNVNTIGPTQNTSDYSIFGALYFLPSGQLIGYGDDTRIGPKGNSQESLVDINIDTGNVTPIATSTSVSTNDGASCPFLIAMDKAGPSEIALGGTITYTFTIYNRTGLLVNNGVFQDVLENSLKFTSNPYDITGGMSINGQTDQQTVANLTIDNIPVGISSFKIDVLVNCSFNSSKVTNQAVIGIDNLNNSVSSNDPNTPEVGDATTVPISLLNLEVPSEILIEGCSLEDINEANAIFNYSPSISEDVRTVFDNNPDYNYSPSNIRSLVYFDAVLSDDGCSSIVTRTFRITDLCGNIVEKIQTITVRDTSPPVINDIPDLITVNCDDLDSIEESFSAIDNCENIIMGTPQDDIIPGSCENDYVIKRVWSFQDTCGNASRFEQTIRVIDTTSPVFNETLPQDITVECENLASPEVLTASDNCGIATVTFNEESTLGTCPVKETITRTWIAKDTCGNETTHVQVITVEDRTAPVINDIPDMLTLSCEEYNSTDNARLNYENPECSSLTITVPLKGNQIDGKVDFGFVDKIVDASGSLLGYRFRVINKTNSPLSNIVIGNDNQTIYSNPQLPAATELFFNSPNSISGVILKYDGGQSGPVNTNNIDSVVSCDIAAQNTNSFNAIDNCDGIIPGTFKDQIIEQGSCENEFMIRRTWTFEDSCSNASIFIQTINVIDNKAPDFVSELPQDISVECDEIPESELLNATDNCGDAIVTVNDVTVEGSCENDYIIERTWTATDACNNETSHTQIITVRDTTPPVIQGVSNDSCGSIVTNGQFENNIFSQGYQQLPQDQVSGWNTSASHGTLEIQRSGQVNGVDSYSGNYHFELNGRNLDDLYQEFETIPGSTITITFFHRKRPGSSVTDDMRLFIGSDLSDLEVVGTYSVSLQDGWKENSLQYVIPDNQTSTVILFQALTGSSNSIGNLLDSISIVSDSSDNELCTIEDITVECDNIPAPAEVIATDNCGEVSIVFNEERQDGNCLNEYNLIRTWTATDSCGNSSSISQTIQVLDDIGPVFNEPLPEDISVECEEIPDPIELTALDNCGESTVSFEEEIIYNDEEDQEENNETENNSCNYRAFYVRASANSQIYEIKIVDGTAIMSLVATTNYSAHLAYDGENNILYALNSNGNRIEKINPDTGESLGIIDLTPGLNSIASGTYYNGKIYLGSSNQDRIVEVDPMTGVWIEIATGVPVSGADMEFKNGQLYLATRSGNKFYAIVNGDAILIGDLPRDVSGMALSEDNQFLISYNGSTSFGLMNENSQLVGSYPILLNGESFSLNNGDMASGCANDDTTIPESCENLYTIKRTWTATDDCGNETVHIQNIGVTDTQAPTFVEALPEDITIECDEIPDPDVLTAVDNCGDADVTYTQVIVPGSCDSQYTIVRSWVAFDTCGNTNTHVQNIDVNNQSDPSFNEELPIDLTVECNSVPEAEDLSASDNCGAPLSVTFEENQTPGSCEGEYLIERIWTTSDGCGNTVTHSQLITVTDTTGPELVGDDLQNIEATCDNIPEPPSLEFMDECSSVMDVVFNEENTQGDDFEDYMIVRTWTVTDSCGNQSIFNQTVNVEIVNNIEAPDSDVCNTDAPFSLFDLLLGDVDESGFWTVVTGNASLDGDIFDPGSVEPDMTYTFNYTLSDGPCPTVSILNVTVDDCVVLSCGQDDVVISKAVTANGDAFNEFFAITGIEDCGFVIELQIFNRWGAKIYESNDYQNDWNGQARGSSIGGSSTVPTGTYYYIINLKNSGLEPFAGPVYVATN